MMAPLTPSVHVLSTDIEHFPSRRGQLYVTQKSMLPTQNHPDDEDLKCLHAEHPPGMSNTAIA
jgi:hypothetical protein